MEEGKYLLCVYYIPKREKKEEKKITLLELSKRCVMNMTIPNVLAIKNISERLLTGHGYKSGRRAIRCPLDLLRFMKLSQ